MTFSIILLHVLLQSKTKIVMSVIILAFLWKADRSGIIDLLVLFTSVRSCNLSDVQKARSRIIILT